jgi:hypothetical protein
VYIHTAGTKTSGSIWYNDQDAWLEALAEMVSGFSSHVGKEHIIYINVMNRLSVDCDCDGNPAEPDIHDIILQDSSFGASSPAVLLNSTVDARIYNIQIDHISADGTVLSLGKKDNEVPPECYFNLTAENLTSKQGDKIILNAPTKNCFFNV